MITKNEIKQETNLIKKNKGRKTKLYRNIKKERKQIHQKNKTVQIKG